MNIFLFSRSAWDDTNSYGNTVSNFFSDKSEDIFYHFYIRKQFPVNGRAKRYYNISVIDVVKKFLKINKKTNIFTKEQLEEKVVFFEEEHRKEQGSIDKIHRGKNQWIYFLTEIIWLSKIWQNKDFQKFVNLSDPDIFFAFATNSYILWPLIKYIKKNTHAKVVLFVADDIHSDIENKAFYRKIYLRPTYRKCINAADKVYGISSPICKKYTEIYKKDVQLLLKGCQFAEIDENKNNSVMRIVYAGNLYYGRADILGKVAEAIEAINKEKTVVRLEIYTPATITDDMDKLLNRSESSVVMGPRPYEEIKSITAQADIVLHVESFEHDQIERVRYSFSTKIIDCLQSGSAILAVGPAGINSIEYLRNIEGTYIIDDVENIKDSLREILSNSEKIKESVHSIRKYALEKHDIMTVRENLRNDLKKLIDFY